MRKLIFTLLILLMGASSVYAQANPTLEVQIEETRRQRDALLVEQRRIQEELEGISRQGQTLTGAVERLDTTKRKLETDLKITQTSIQGANLTINKLNSTIDTKEEEVILHRKAIYESLIKLAEYDQESFVFNLLAYDNVSDAWRDTAGLMDLQDKLGTRINELRIAQQTLEKSISAKETQKKNLENLKGELSGQKKIVEENKTVKAKLLAQTKNQESAFQKLLADNIKRQAQAEALLFQFESQLKVGDKTLVPKPMKGLLAWPVDKPFITQQFGRSAGASRLYASGSHNGIDMRAPVGTRILSMGNGIVVDTGNTDLQPNCYSYGRWVLIKYDNRLSAVYGHMSGLIVSPGQSVTTGQVVGYSGGQPGVNGSGYSTGPHLHVGLFASGNVRVAQYSASINCKNVAIPLANPSDYLDPLAYLP